MPAFGAVLFADVLVSSSSDVQAVREHVFRFLVITVPLSPMHWCQKIVTGFYCVHQDDLAPPSSGSAGPTHPRASWPPLPTVSTHPRASRPPLPTVSPPSWEEGARRIVDSHLTIQPALPSSCIQFCSNLYMAAGPLGRARGYG